MSNAIPFNTIPTAIVGMEVQVPREKMQELRRAGTLQQVVSDAMAAGITEHIKNKHGGDVEMAALDGAINTAGRSYRLEIVTFTRRQWVAHTHEWAELEAERDALREELAALKGEAPNGQRQIN